MKKVVIIGAGPAGITAGYQLLKESKDYDVTILEAEDRVGGIAKTIEHNGNRMDLGGHRFFTKNEEVKKWWDDILSKQGQPAYDDRVLKRFVDTEPGGPDPEFEDDVMLVRKRVSSIYFNEKFFDYPVKFNSNTIKNLGLGQTAKAGFSYLEGSIFKKKEDNLENFYMNHFGKQLYQTFFEGYTEKLWGRHPSQISADWGAQRMKGLTISSILKDTSHKKKSSESYDENTSLSDEFLYPKLGPGQMWELASKRFVDKGGKIIFNCKATGIETENNVIKGVRCVLDGAQFIQEADIVISSMPIKDLILGMKNVPFKVTEVARGLPYRDFVILGLLVPKLKIQNTSKIKTLNNIVPDCWIYVQDTSVKLGRIQIYNNWSPYLVEKPEETVWLGLEYFCNEGDYYWNQSDIQWQTLAVSELIKMGIIDDPPIILDFHKEMIRKAYPAYFDTYSRFDEIKTFLDGYPNLYCIGRNGQHRYNNMDHTMMTAFETVRTIVAGRTDKTKVWAVNMSAEYHESTPNTALIEPARAKIYVEGAVDPQTAAEKQRMDEFAKTVEAAKQNEDKKKGFNPMMSIRDRLSIRSIRKPKQGNSAVNYALLSGDDEGTERNSYRTNAAVPIRSNYQEPANPIDAGKQPIRRKPSGVRNSSTMPEDTYVVKSAPVKKDAVIAEPAAVPVDTAPMPVIDTASLSATDTTPMPAIDATPASMIDTAPMPIIDTAEMPVIDETVIGETSAASASPSGDLFTVASGFTAPASDVTGDAIREVVEKDIPTEIPVAEEPVFAEEETVPVTEEPVFAEEETVPVTEEPAFIEEETVPATEEPAFIEEEIAPVTEEIEEEIPVMEASVPVEEYVAEEPLEEETVAEESVEEEPVAEEPVKEEMPAFIVGSAKMRPQDKSEPVQSTTKTTIFTPRYFHDEPAFEEPVFAEPPAAPVYEEPAAPVYEEPAAPVYEEPVAPVYEEPAAPIYEEAVASVYEQPVYEQPVYDQSVTDNVVYDAADGVYEEDVYMDYASRNEEYDSTYAPEYAGDYTQTYEDGYYPEETSADVYPESVPENTETVAVAETAADGGIQKSNDFGSIFAMPTEDETKSRKADFEMPYEPVVAPVVNLAPKKEEKKEFLNQTGFSMEKMEKVLKTEISIKPKKQDKEEPAPEVMVVSVPKPSYKKAKGVFTPKPMTEEEKRQIEEEERAKRPIAPSINFKKAPEPPPVEEHKTQRPRKKNFAKPTVPITADWESMNAKTLRELPELETVKQEETAEIKVQKSDLPNYNIYSEMTYDNEPKQKNETADTVVAQNAAAAVIEASVQAAELKAQKVKEQEQIAAAVATAEKLEEIRTETHAPQIGAQESASVTESKDAAGALETSETMSPSDTLATVAAKAQSQPVKRKSVADIEVPKDLFANARVIAVIKNGVKTSTVDEKTSVTEAQPVKKTIQKYTSDFETTTVKSIRKLRAMRQEKAIQDITRMLEGSEDRKIVSPRPKPAPSVASVFESTSTMEEKTEETKPEVIVESTPETPADDSFHLDLRLKDGSHRVVEGFDFSKKEETNTVHDVMQEMLEGSTSGETAAAEETAVETAAETVTETPESTMETVSETSEVIVNAESVIETEPEQAIEVEVISEQEQAVTAETVAENIAEPVEEEKPVSKTRKTARKPKAENTEEGEGGEAAPKKRGRKSTKSVASDDTLKADETGKAEEGAPEVVTAKKPRKPRAKKTTESDQQMSLDITSGNQGETSADGGTITDTPAKPKRTYKRKPKPAENVADTASTTADGPVNDAGATDFATADTAAASASTTDSDET